MTHQTRKPAWTPKLENQRVIPIIGKEIDDFEREVGRFQSGEWKESEFLAFRLRQGVYGQRQPDRHMVRVKVPFGGLTADQMDVLGRIASEYPALKKGHVTTRQNIQFHNVSLEASPEILRILADAGISTREAAGNTVRNVTGSPTAGVAQGEVFDPTPYAGAYARYFVRMDLTHNMPRKIKTAFVGSDRDEAITGIHDIGFKSVIKNGKKGFRMTVGGGLSTMPRTAVTLYEFVSVDDYLSVTEACLRVFNRSEEERKDRMRARLKFMIGRLGIEEFRRLVEKELQGDWAEKPIDLDALLWLDDEEADAPPRRGVTTSASPGDAPAGFEEWVRTNVEPQRQDGYNVVRVRLENGDLYAHQWSPLATIVREHGGGRARLDIQQNVVIRWVPAESLLGVYDRLGEIGLNRSGCNTIADITSCPGTDSCKLGITSSMGLGTAISEVLASYDVSDPLINEIHIKASGCPNSCGHHLIADIGFHGAIIKGPGGHHVPAYEMFLGGHYERGDVAFGTRASTRLPAKRVPAALTAVLDFYRAERQDGERFRGFVLRRGVAAFESLLEQFSQPAPRDREHIEEYVDWDRTGIYRLERGEGECSS